MGQIKGLEYGVRARVWIKGYCSVDLMKPIMHYPLINPQLFTTTHIVSSSPLLYALTLHPYSRPLLKTIDPDQLIGQRIQSLYCFVDPYCQALKINIE
jgi:hypothetical protein